MCLASTALSYSQEEVAPFHITYWFADAVAIGTVVNVNDETIDVEIQEWMRARKCLSPKLIRAVRYTTPSCVPHPPEPTPVASEYLFLLRKPHDQGAGDNQYWLVLWQLNLAPTSVCLADGLWPSDAKGPCREPIELRDFLDAVRSFDTCFLLYDDPIKGTYPTSTLCSQKALHDWASRSAFHAALVRVALQSIERQGSR